MNIYEHRWTSMKTHSNQCNSMKTYEHPWHSVKAGKSTWTPMSANNKYWTFLDIDGNRWEPTRINEHLLESAGTYERPWRSTKPDADQWKPIDMLWHIMNTNESQWPPTTINEHQWKPIPIPKIVWTSIRIHKISKHLRSSTDIFEDHWTYGKSSNPMEFTKLSSNIVVYWSSFFRKRAATEYNESGINKNDNWCRCGLRLARRVKARFVTDSGKPFGTVLS